MVLTAQINFWNKLVDFTSAKQFSNFSIGYKKCAIKSLRNDLIYSLFFTVKVIRWVYSILFPFLAVFGRRWTPSLKYIVFHCTPHIPDKKLNSHQKMAIRFAHVGIRYSKTQKILYLALSTYDIGMPTLQGQHPFINIQFELIIYFWNWLRLIKNDQKGLNSNKLYCLNGGWCVLFSIQTNHRKDSRTGA